jgi:hypothetical protein
MRSFNRAVSAAVDPEPEKGGRGKKSEAIKSAETAGFSSRRLNEARTVLRHSQHLAFAVRDGDIDFAGGRDADAFSASHWARH